MFSNFFRKPCRFWDNVEKHRMHCCVPIATMVTRTRHNVTLYVLCLFCYKIPSFYGAVFTVIHN